MATGNGRCNFSNAVIDAGRYRNASFVEEALGACEATFEGGASPGDDSPPPVDVRANAVLRFFAERGLPGNRLLESALQPRLPGAQERFRVLPGHGGHEIDGQLVARLHEPAEIERGDARHAVLSKHHLAHLASVLDCLRAACTAAGVRELVESEVAAVEAPRGEGDRFTLRLVDRRLERADAGA